MSATARCPGCGSEDGDVDFGNLCRPCVVKSADVSAESLEAARERAATAEDRLATLTAPCEAIVAAMKQNAAPLKLRYALLNMPAGQRVELDPDLLLDLVKALDEVTP